MDCSLSRRAMLAGLAGLAAYGLPVPAAADYLRSTGSRLRSSVEIRPRIDWAGTSRPPAGPIGEEDVRLLVVHHTLIPNNAYGADDVTELLRDIYDYHTGPEKGWPDIAYNFMVDQFGTVWEARSGSLDGPVQGSATGGNQGFSQLCCFLGDLTSEPPTPAAAASMAGLLATLADRYGIDTSEGTEVDLVSRGSSRYPAGAPMTVPTLCGHRDVSLTACPGEAGYAFVTDTLPALVNALRASTATTTTTATPTTETPTTTAATTTTVATTTSAGSEATAGSTADSVGREDSVLAFGEETGGDGGGDGWGLGPIVGSGLALGAAGIGILLLSKRGGQDRIEPDSAAGPEPEAAGVGATLAGETTERADGTIDLPARLGMAQSAATVINPPPAAPGRIPSPQRVWWALDPDAGPEVGPAVDSLVRDIQRHASVRPGDDADDRRQWAGFDALLVARSGGARAAIVAARSDAVYILRSEPCLVVVRRPDGVEKRDESRDALHIRREDVGELAVYLDPATETPDIEVSALREDGPQAGS